MTSTSGWTFITNQGLILSYIFHIPTIIAREIAIHVGITEQTTRKIISDLEIDLYVTRSKRGRRNVYRVDPNLPLRHHTNEDVMVSGLIEALTSN